MRQAQVIGTGTYLDSQRLRVSLSKELNMSAHCIHAYGRVLCSV